MSFAFLIVMESQLIESWRDIKRWKATAFPDPVPTTTQKTAQCSLPIYRDPACCLEYNIIGFTIARQTQNEISSPPGEVSIRYEL